MPVEVTRDLYQSRSSGLFGAPVLETVVSSPFGGLARDSAQNGLVELEMIWASIFSAG